jgi:hypothetical protein
MILRTGAGLILAGRGLELVQPEIGSGEAPPAYVRTAFIGTPDGAPVLNDPAHPYSAPENAAIALSDAYPGQSVTFRFLDSLITDDLNLSSGGYAFTSITFMGHEGVQTWAFTNITNEGAAGAADGGAGGNAPHNLTFDAIVGSGNVLCSGGPGAEATTELLTGGPGGNAANVTLLNASVIANVDANGGVGGAGGPGTDSFPSGNGGDGGDGGMINHDATSSATLHSENFGAGGVPGGDGGAGTGSNGADGNAGDYVLI